MFGIASSLHVTKWTPENGIHLTLFFNTFVFLTIFNEINTRKLKKDESNVFDGFMNNPLFLFVIIFTITIQFFLVEYGGQAVKCSPLLAEHFLICMALGLTSLVV